MPRQSLKQEENRTQHATAARMLLICSRTSGTGASWVSNVEAREMAGEWRRDEGDDKGECG